MRLAIWTAQNDFREACKTELEAGLQQTAAYNKTLAELAQPPPIMKRTTSYMDRDVSRELAPWVAATVLSLLLALGGILQSLAQRQGNSASPGMESLSSEQLVGEILERTESPKQAVLSFLGICLARETGGTKSVSVEESQKHMRAIIFHVGRFFPSSGQISEMQAIVPADVLNRS